LGLYALGLFDEQDAVVVVICSDHGPFSAIPVSVMVRWEPGGEDR
jgi:hypothetical protein